MDKIDEITHRLDLLPEVGIMAKADLIMLAENEQSNPHYIGACIYESALRHGHTRTFEEIAIALKCDSKKLRRAWLVVYSDFDSDSRFNWG